LVIPEVVEVDGIHEVGVGKRSSKEEHLISYCVCDIKLDKKDEKILKP